MTPEEFTAAIGAQSLGRFEDMIKALTPEKRAAVAVYFNETNEAVDQWAEGNNLPATKKRWQIVRALTGAKVAL